MSGKVFNPKDNTYIIPSNTWLFFKNGNTYTPYELKQAHMLVSCREALMGYKKFERSEAFKNTYVRFGWLDKNRNSLEWIPLSQLLENYRNKTITKQQRSKLNHVCRLLFISIKDIKH